MIYFSWIQRENLTLHELSMREDIDHRINLLAMLGLFTPQEVMRMLPDIQVLLKMVELILQELFLPWARLDF